ncbi:MAG: ABC transporter permease subunit [Bacillota bacterium]|nr:ABC transporter permease subunit [Bacillota bacterium]
MQVNPVIEKELKIKMRGWKAPTLITVYLGFLGLIVFLNFLGSKVISPNNVTQFNPPIALNSYYSLATFQLLMLAFITPAMTGGAISGERERQTLDLLLCTNLSPFSVVIGKIFVSIAHVILLIAASLPILGTVFLYGGIGITDLLVLFAFYLATAIMLGSMGIFYSSIFKRSSVSMIMSYITVLFLLFGTIIIYGIWSSIFSNNTGIPPGIGHTMAFMFPNPIYGFGSILYGSSYGAGIPGGLSGIISTVIPMSGSVYGGNTPNTTFPMFLGIQFKPWMANITFDLIVSFLFIFVSTIRIQPAKRFRLRIRRKKSQLEAQIIPKN